MATRTCRASFADVAQLVEDSLGKLSRLAGVSVAGTRWRNPERSEGPPEGEMELERE